MRRREPRPDRPPVAEYHAELNARLAAIGEPPASEGEAFKYHTLSFPLYAAVPHLVKARKGLTTEV